MSDFELDMINDFVEEAKELLASIEDDFITLEKQKENPDLELVNKLFRAVHTIKGTSGFLGLKNIGKIGHIMEAVMARIRDGELKPTSEYIDALLTGADLLKKMTANIAESNETDIETVFERLSNIVNENSLNSSDTVSSEQQTVILDQSKIITSNESPEKTEKAAAYDSSLINEFVTDAKKIIQSVEADVKSLKDQLPEPDIMLINRIHRAVDTFRSTSEMLSFKNLQKTSELIAFLLLKIRNRQIIADNQHCDLLLKALDKINSMLDDVSFSNEMDLADFFSDFNRILNNKPITDFSSSQDKKVTDKTEPLPDDERPIRYQATEGIKEPLHIKAPEASNSVRIHINVLDKLMRLAGELVLVRNQQIINIHQSGGINRGIIQKLDKVTTELQETIIQTRLQPIASLFGKFPRVIRELNRKLNKEIALKISGSEVEMDKNIIELLAGPLTHLVRNAGDHGIETTEERIKYGKPIRGKIELKAYHEGSFVIIEVTDDGKGINPEIIKKSALRLGMKTESDILKMNETEVLSMVLLPGFTTAKEISDISGRGVGMDVVKESVEKVNGTIELQSKIGYGTTVYLKVPLTLAIIQCLVITTEGNYYAIPQINLEELITLYDNDIDEHIESTGDQEVFMLRNTLLPIVRLNECLKHPQKLTKKNKRDIVDKYGKDNSFHELDFSPDNDQYCSINYSRELHFAVLKFGKHKFGLIFDKIIGTEEIVVKPMHPVVKNLKIYSGATIMGNGKVALILDVENIALHTSVDFNLSDTFASKNKTNQPKQDKESILLFKAGQKEQFALALPLIKRVDQIKLSEIQKAGNEEFYIKDNATIKIIRLNSIINVSACEEKDNMFLILPKFSAKPCGILTSEIIDIKDFSLNIDTATYVADGIMGTDIIEQKLTLFLDLYQIIELSDPAYIISEEKTIRATMPNIEIKVLVAEDSSYMRQLIKGYLTEAGYVVETAEDGNIALDKLIEQKFDLIVSDLEMPNMNGFEFITNVRKGNIQSDIPAIANSSLNSPDIIKKALDCGFNKYIVKIQKEKLLATVSTLIQESLNN
jgi:two-component system chemotaxis sensor kinase CheA